MSVTKRPPAPDLFAANCPHLACKRAGLCRSKGRAACLGQKVAHKALNARLLAAVTKLSAQTERGLNAAPR